jgi:hypothetical protein
MKELVLPISRLELANMMNSALESLPLASRARIILLVQFDDRPAAIWAFHP